MEKIIEIQAGGDALPMLLRDYLRSLNLSTAVIKEAKRAGIYLNGKAESLAASVKLAGALIDSSSAMATLQKVIEVSNRPEE